MAEKKQTTEMTRTVGRRKTAAARARMTLGKGVITINGRELANYFPVDLWRAKVTAPFEVVGRDNQFDVSVKVAGGGVHAQAEAVRHAIARALVRWDEALKPVLRAEGFLTRDPRAKERKKFGLRGARRGHQWRKR